MQRLVFLISIIASFSSQVWGQSQASNSLQLINHVNKSKASQGDIITHTLILTNAGTTTATDIVVRDSTATGLRYIANSSVTPGGTTFTAQSPINTWSIPSLSAGQSLSMAYQATADSTGILYSKATIPGDTATVCTSIPVRVCQGDTYLFQLTGPAGRSSYRWFRNGTELANRTTRVLEVTSPGSYSLAVDSVAGKCPDFSCCPFIIEEYPIPQFQASTIPAGCSDVAQATGQLVLTNFGATDTYQYSEGTEFTLSAALSGPPKQIPTNGILADNLSNPAAGRAYTIRVYNAAGCYTDKTVTLLPSACCGLTATALTGPCTFTTNTFSSTVIITLTNPVAGTLTITDGPSSQTVATTTDSQKYTAIFDGLITDGASHTVVVSLPGCSSTSTTYTAPASCSVSMALIVNPGDCQEQTNTYAVTGSLSLTNAVAGVATFTDGVVSETIAVNAGSNSLSYALAGLVSGTGSHTVTASYADQLTSFVYTAPTSCSVAPAVPALALSVAPGSCEPTTNRYTLSGTISLTASPAGSLTLTDGTTMATVALTAGQTTAEFTLSGLLADAGLHTLTVSGAGYDPVSATYTAPASCSVAPAVPALAVSVAPGSCEPTTNQYTLSGTISLTASPAGSLTLTDGTTTATVALTAGQTTAEFTLSGLLADAGLHTLTVSGAGYDPVSATYTAPASCSVAPAVPALALSVTPGSCEPTTNRYTLSGTISLTASPAGSLTLTDGTTMATVALTAGHTTAEFTLSGLLADAGMHTLTVSGAGYAPVSATYTAPASCSVAPAVPALALSVTPGSCEPTTNRYTLSGTISLTASPAGSLTLTDGTTMATVALTAGHTTAEFTLSGLLADAGMHTLTVSGAGYAPVSATYTAPTSCSVAPAVPALAVSVTPGSCEPTTNRYTLSGTISLTASPAGSLTLTDGTTMATVALTAGQTTAEFTLSGLLADAGLHTLTVSGAGYAPISATYTAPTSCSVAPAVPALAVRVTPGSCEPTTNQYTLSGTISLTASPAGSLTLTDGTTTATVALTAGQTTAEFTLSGLLADAGMHTLTVSGAGYAPISATYTAPASCSVAPAVPALAVRVTPGSCEPTTNQYTLSGTISLTASPAGSLTLTDGTTTATVALTAGQTTAEFTLSGLLADAGMHTLTVSGAGYAPISATYTAPASCSVAPAVPALAVRVTPGSCEPTTNQYTLSGTISLTASPAGSLTLTDGTTTATVALTAGQTTAEFTLSGLLADAGMHTLTVSGAGYAPISATYTAPASCSVAPAVPALAVRVTPGSCEPTTNQYTLSGTISLTASPAGSLTLTDGTTTATVALTAGQTTAEFTLSGLLADAGLHTLTVSGAGYDPVSATYTAPASCSVTPVPPALPTTPELAFLNLVPSDCDPTTNHYTLSGVISLTASMAGSLTLTDGATTETIAIVEGQSTTKFSLVGLTSDAGVHTLTVSGAGYAPVSATYTAPTSCSVAPAVPALAVRVTPGSCEPTTNRYTLSGTISLTASPAGSLTLTDGTTTATVALTAGQTTAEFTLSGLLADAGLHTLTVSGAGYDPVSATYTAPASCSVTPVPPALPTTPELAFLNLVPSDCDPTTNHYTLSGVISLTASMAGSLTLTDGATTETIAIVEGQSTTKFSLVGLTSDAGVHTLTVSGAGYAPVSATYTAPTSCSVAPAVPALAVRVTPGSCEPTTNRYTLSGTISLTASPAGSLTLTDGTTTATVALTAGQTTAEFTLSGLLADAGLHTLTVSGAGYAPVSTTYTAPASCSVAPAVPTVALRVTDPGICIPATNQYTSTGIITFTNAPAGTAIITDGNATRSISVSAGTTSLPYSLTGLPSGSGVHNVIVTFASQTASTTYTAPESCTQSTPASLILEHMVNKSKVKIGELVSYTVVLTNTGTSPATGVAVQVSKTTGLQYIADSVSAPTGTTFTQGTAVSIWTVPLLSAGQTLSFSFQARADSTGILYNKATIPGDTAIACISVPVKVCVDEEYNYRITAAPGRSSYQWFRTFNGVTTEMTSFTTNVLDVTQPGEYKLSVDNQQGKCPDFSCCPFIVEEDSLPAFQATAMPVTCTGSNPQGNGKLVLNNFNPVNTYQYSAGDSFNQAASLSGSARVIPQDGVLVSNLVNPTVAQNYTIRVYNRSGCYSDVTVILEPTICACPAEVCVPFVINQTKRAKRIGDAR